MRFGKKLPLLQDKRENMGARPGSMPQVVADIYSKLLELQERNAALEKRVAALEAEKQAKN